MRVWPLASARENSPVPAPPVWPRAIRAVAIIVGSSFALLAAAQLIAPFDHAALAQLRLGLISVGSDAGGAGLRPQAVRQPERSEVRATDIMIAAEIEQQTGELAQLEAEWEKLRLSGQFSVSLGSKSSDGGASDFPRLLSEMSVIRAQRHEAEARFYAARNLELRSAAESIPEVQKSAVIQGIVAQRTRAERDLVELALQFQPAHPRMKQLNAMLAEIRRRLRSEIAGVVAGLQHEARSSARREEMQSHAIVAAAARLPTSSEAMHRLVALEARVSVTRRSLEGLRDRQRSTCCRPRADVVGANSRTH